MLHAAWGGMHKGHKLTRGTCMHKSYSLLTYSLTFTHFTVTCTVNTDSDQCKLSGAGTLTGTGTGTGRSRSFIYLRTYLMNAQRGRFLFNKEVNDARASPSATNMNAVLCLL